MTIRQTLIFLTIGMFLILLLITPAHSEVKNNPSCEETLKFNQQSLNKLKDELRQVKSERDEERELRKELQEQLDALTKLEENINERDIQDNNNP